MADEMVTNDEMYALSIGSVIDSDRASRDIADVIGRMSRQLNSVQHGLNAISPIQVTVVFHVESVYRPVGFQGIRIGLYRKKDARLAMQVAVPLVSVEEAPETMIALLRGAVEEAEVWTKRKGLSDSLPVIRESLRQFVSVWRADYGEGVSITVPRQEHIHRRRTVPVVVATSAAPALRVTIESGETWDDPSEDLLFMLLDDIEAGEGTFLILERMADSGGDTYIQAQKQVGGHYLVERREGAPEEHWATEVADMRATHRLITGWAFGLDGWSAHVNWARVVFDN